MGNLARRKGKGDVGFTLYQARLLAASFETVDGAVPHADIVHLAIGTGRHYFFYLVLLHNAVFPVYLLLFADWYPVGIVNAGRIYAEGTAVPFDLVWSVQQHATLRGEALLPVHAKTEAAPARTLPKGV